MGRQKQGARVLGPYREEYGDGPVWRVVQVEASGTRTAHYARSEREANQLVKACWLDLGIPLNREFSITDAIDGWLKQKKETESWGKRTFERTAADVRFFAAANPDAPMKGVNVQWVQKYLERLSHLALASRQSRYHAVAEFLSWAVRKGHLSRNPCDLIDPVELPWRGKRARRKLGRGKPQLRNVGEVEKYLAAAATLPKTLERVAAVLPVLCGLRSGEVRHVRVADCDFGAGRIWIRDIEGDDEDEVEGWDVKSAAGRRTVDLPEHLAHDFAALVDGKRPEDFVFGSNRRPGEARERKWLNRLVQRVCEKAEVRVICAHGLRDTHTSILAELGQRSAADIARLVGHADQGKTAKKHYIGTPEHRPALRLVAGRDK